MTPSRFTHRPALRDVRFAFALFTSLALVSGCGSTVHMVSKKHLQPFNGGTQVVYVTNPEMRREYEILRTSGVYQLSSKPEGARLLTLHPLGQYGRCGNPLLLSALTLGIIPGFMPGARLFEYELETNGLTERHVHNLPVWERFSIWEWLVRCDEEKVFAEALSWSAGGWLERNQVANQNRPLEDATQP